MRPVHHRVYQALLTGVANCNTEPITNNTVEKTVVVRAKRTIAIVNDAPFRPFLNKSCCHSLCRLLSNTAYYVPFINIYKILYFFTILMPYEHVPYIIFHQSLSFWKENCIIHVSQTKSNWSASRKLIGWNWSVSRKLIGW